uniref:MATH domain-containing protein n=1 Tax=Ananas comosus var. bracteatus TaxID=296719 RepID=A0A6V7P573_ANACO|nr:unnamed protein product [Ananas comosus var. bracteatus]
MSTSAAARSSESLSKWTMEKAIGSHLFHVADYSLARTIGVGKSISSAVFDVGGLDWSIKCYPAGGTPQNSNYLALFLALESDARNVKAAFRLALLDQRMKPSSKTPRTTARTRSRTATTPSATTASRPPFARRGAAVRPAPASRPALGERRGERRHLRSRRGHFRRAPVVARRALARVQGGALRSDEGEQNAADQDRRYGGCGVQGLLHFIYSDSLPPLMEELAKESAVLMAQHLLAAADRYGLERLRLICESKLSQQVDAGTVATTLALAEQHHCRKLKAICLNFIDSPEVLIAVMRTDGFEHLKTSCPALLENLLKKLG